MSTSLLPGSALLGTGGFPYVPNSRGDERGLVLVLVLLCGVWQMEDAAAAAAAGCVLVEYAEEGSAMERKCCSAAVVMVAVVVVVGETADVIDLVDELGSVVEHSAASHDRFPRVAVVVTWTEPAEEFHVGQYRDGDSRGGGPGSAGHGGEPSSLLHWKSCCEAKEGVEAETVRRRMATDC